MSGIGVKNRGKWQCMGTSGQDRTVKEIWDL